MKDHELKAKPWAGTASGAVARKVGKPAVADSGANPAFEGVVALTADEYARFEECMTNPPAPTEAILKGEALRRRLYHR